MLRRSSSERFNDRCALAGGPLTNLKDVEDELKNECQDVMAGWCA